MSVSAIIPAYQAAATVGETVRAVRRIPGVSQVIVVDDGSRDGTGEVARRAGADRIVSLPRNRGKGAALAAGLEAATGERVLFLDADLGESAAHAGALLTSAGRESIAVAVFAGAPGGGGFGLARGLASATIRLLTSLRPLAPLSGQRALPARLARHVGLAPRFGAEVGLTVEAAHLGVAVVEVPLPLAHRRTGRTAAGFLHRARQLRDVLRLLLLTGYGLGWPALARRHTAARFALWLCVFGGLIALGGLTDPPAHGLLALAAACSAAALLPSLWMTAVWLRLRKPNYLGRSLPAAAGALFLLVGLPAAWFSPLPWEARASALLVIGALGAVGLTDDLYSRGRQARGLRGHLLALARGRLTTGGAKAIVGLVAGLTAGRLLHPGRPGEMLLDGLLIALSANFINLLDLRPSRALKGFGLLCLVAVVAAPNSLYLLGPLLAAAIALAPAEFAGRLMLGDVGANALGGAAGLALAFALSPGDRLAAVLLLLAFHLWCERFSLSEVIARRCVLRALDRLGTAHLSPCPPTEAARW